MMKKKKKKTKMNKEDLTLVGHLTELRRRIIISGLSIIIFSLIGYYFAENIALNLIDKASDMEFIYISPAELMLSYIRIGVYAGIVMAFPIIFSQIWLFVNPGIEKKHRKYLILAVIIGGIFFIVGVTFAYILVLPIIFTFFSGFQIDEIKASISFGNYLSFAIRIILSFGLVFELPILMFLLSRFNIVKPVFFEKYRKHMVVLIFLVAAFLTPPDVVSQSLIALPMLVLYQLGIILAKLGQGKKEKNKD